MTLRRVGLALLILLIAALGALAWRLDREPVASPSSPTVSRRR
jgi:hypothetical protein